VLASIVEPYAFGPLLNRRNPKLDSESAMLIANSYQDASVYTRGAANIPLRIALGYAADADEVLARRDAFLDNVLKKKT
jgi:hypothetical protein